VEKLQSSEKTLTAHVESEDEPEQEKSPNSQEGINASVSKSDLDKKRTKNDTKTQEELRLFSLAVKMSLDGIIIGDINGKITYVNDTLLKMYGSTDKNNFQGKHILEFIVERDHARAIQNSMECLRTGEGKMGEFNALNKKGVEIPVEVTTAIIKNEKGEGIGFVDIVRDIAERKRAQESLRQSEEKYRLLFENMMDGYAYCQILCDDKGKPIDFIYLEVNDAFEKLTGLKKSDVLGKKATEAIPDIKKAHPELFEIYGRVALTGESQRFEIEFQPLIIWLNISVYSTKKGYFAAVFENVTEQKQRSEKIEEYSRGLEFTVSERTKELVEAQARLLKTERLVAIGELAAMVGHDLRNPLAGIKNAAYFLRKKQASFIGDSGNEMLTVIDRSVEYANNIVTDLLEFSREIHLELEEYSPKSLVNYIMLTINIPRNVKISEHTQSYPSIWIDVNKVERVFINLIKNAIDAMPNGGTIDIRSCPRGGNVEFTFADTGSGMSAEVMARIFTPLFTTKAKGMGLGLAICKRIVEAHGGKITVESTLNKGTTFTVLFPIEQKIGLETNK
jgi:PAS domain S-box-containing protein